MYTCSTMPNHEGNMKKEALEKANKFIEKIAPYNVVIGISENGKIIPIIFRGRYSEKISIDGNIEPLIVAYPACRHLGKVCEGEFYWID